MDEENTGSNVHQGLDANVQGRSITEAELTQFLMLMWASSGNTEDRQRWHQQGFRFCGNPTFGLEQGHGGPCGVLAAVQAELMRYLIFGPDDDGDEDREGSGQLPQDLGTELLQDALVQAMMTILWRVKTDGGVISIVSAANLPVDINACCSDFRVHSFTEKDHARVHLVQHLEHYQSISGTILFVLSILLTHGLDTVLSEMDGPDCTLTGQFGHCSQELLNLLLCGQASSNVFDGEIPMGDSGLTLKGVPARSKIGYLTHLEALRYCQVGSFFKSPLDPVWVVGSSSHFTVIFGIDKKPVTESAGERLLEKVQRAFREIDSQGDGYISVGELGTVLRSLKLPAGEDSNQLSALAAKLEVAGANIILWEEFWKVVSLLMTGGTIEQVLTGEAKKPEVVREITGTPQLQRDRSDSEVARELQLQLDNEASTPSVTPVQNQRHTLHRTDSDVARELQQQFDQEQQAVAPSTGVLPNVTSQEDEKMPDLIEIDPPSQQPTSARTGLHRHDSVAEPGGSSFILYHYNGQQSGGRQTCLTRFAVTKRSDENAVGESIPISAGQGGASFSCPIEEVLRTKWPGCRVDWFNANVPSID